MITQKDIDILNFLHDRLVTKYGENENTDYLIAAREAIIHVEQFKNSSTSSVSNLCCPCCGSEMKCIDNDNTWVCENCTDNE